jgi:hypothetical protein
VADGLNRPKLIETFTNLASAIGKNQPLAAGGDFSLAVGQMRQPENEVGEDKVRMYPSSGRE